MMRIRRHKMGFTLVELMIASSVFAIVLLLLTTGIIQIGKVFFKGTTAANTQEVTRSVIENISRSIQLSGAQVNQVNGSVFCVGSTRYRMSQGVQLNQSTDRALTRDTVASCNANAADGSNVRELIGPRMRISKLQIVPDGETGFYTITVRVVYGDIELLCNAADPNSCSSTSTLLDVNNVADLSCKNGQEGTQFCSASELTTTVQRRIQ